MDHPVDVMLLWHTGLLYIGEPGDKVWMSYTYFVEMTLGSSTKSQCFLMNLPED